MTYEPTALVVLIDAEDVRHAFADWPEEICLAVCLLSDGDCTMMLFRRDERPVIPARVLDTLRLPESDVSFVPEVPGFATRQFMYSDERRLMALVASDPSILDEATDYMVNYTYAVEEGLDPEMVLGLKPAAPQVVREAPRPAAPQAETVRTVLAEPRATAEADRRAPPRELSPLLPDFLRKSAEQRRTLRFSTVRTAQLDALAASH